MNDIKCTHIIGCMPWIKINRSMKSNQPTLISKHAWLLLAMKNSYAKLKDLTSTNKCLAMAELNPLLNETMQNILVYICSKILIYYNYISQTNCKYN